MNGHIRVDLAGLPDDALSVLRWIAREEGDRDDQDRAESLCEEPLLCVDPDVIHAVALAVSRKRAWVDPAEAQCLRLLIQAASYLFGEASLQMAAGILSGFDERYVSAYDGLPAVKDQVEAFEELAALAHRIAQALEEVSR